MAWQIEPDLEHLVTTLVAGRRDVMSREIRDKGAALAEQLSSRGMGISGASITGNAKICDDAYEIFAQGVIDDVLGLFRSVYGEIPVEAAPWLKEHLLASIDGVADGVVAEDERRRRAMTVQGRRERPHGWSSARRRIDVELGTLELKARLRTLTPPERPSTAAAGADLFICHASEDKAAVARPIADALRAKGYVVWLDETELRIGDTLLTKIDEGLANCRYGLVVLSPSFFNKKWTRRELAGLVARQDAEDRVVVLPVWHDVDDKAIAQRLPSLAGVLAAKMADGVDRVLADIVRAIGAPKAEGV